MGSASGNVPDWTDARSYAPLLRAERAAFAWEWLRRDPDFRAAAGVARAVGGGEERRIPARPAEPAAAAWDLHLFEDPSLTAPFARPVWRAAAHPLVLKVRASPDGADQDRFDLSRFASWARVALDAAGREYVLLSDGLRSIRLDVHEGSTRAGPVRLAYQLAGICAVERPLLTLRRLLLLSRTGRFSSTLHPEETRARRWVLLLRTQDGLLAGASQRDIAAHLLSPDASAADWRSNAPSLRSQAQRLARTARRLAAGSYRQFLR